MPGHPSLTLLPRTSRCCSLKLYNPEGCGGSQAYLATVKLGMGGETSFQAGMSLPEPVSKDQLQWCQQPGREVFLPGALSSFPCCPVQALSPALGRGGDCWEKAPPSSHPICALFAGGGVPRSYSFSPHFQIA